MRIPVLIEKVAGDGYRATSGQPVGCAADGATPDQAIDNLRAAIRARLDPETRLVSIEIEASDHPLYRSAGIFKDDPLFDEWQQSIEEYRQSVDEQHGDA
jgi:hypothetical protein